MLLRRPLLLPLWPEPSAWRRCAYGTAGGPQRRFRTAIGRESPLAAVPALAEFPGSLQAFLCIEPLVLYALWTLVPDLFVLPAVFVCVASLGRGCFLMGAAAVRLLDAAFRLLRTAGPDGRVFPSFRCRILAGVGCFGAVPFALGSPWQGKRELESSSFHPLRREPRPTKLHPTAYVLRILTPNRCWL